ncbi:MAG: HlyD family secretion protein [Thermacetogeniaceae bacterium]
MDERQATGQDQNSSNGSRKKIGLAIGALVLLAAIAGGIWYWHYLRVTVSTDDAQVTGDIADISPKIAGRLEKIDVSEGDVVTVGQELAELDNAALLVAMNQAEGALELAKANYDKLPDDIKSAQAGVDKAGQGLLAAQAQVKVDEFSLSNAKRNLGQTQALFSSGAASQEALDDAQSNYGSAQAKLDADTANVQSAQSALQAAQANLESVNNTSADSYLAQLKQAQAGYDNAKLTYDESFIYATVSGTVVRLPGVVGEYLSPGTPILSISNLQATWVVANVEETDYGRLRLGQQVAVRVDAYPGKIFSGQVIELGGATQATFDLLPVEADTGNFTKIAQRVPVKIAVTDKGNYILEPGMSVEVKIHTA